MATIEAAPALHRLTYDDVVRMYEAGILDDERQRVEVLDGQLIDLAPPGPRHDGTVAKLTRRFARALPDELELRPQLVLRLGPGDFVIPDLMVVDAAVGVEAQPTSARLVIEIAHTSQQHDRAKTARYAAAGVPEYWIADLAAEVVHVHREPDSEDYGQRTEHTSGVLVPLIGTPEVPVAELLGLPG